MTHDEIEKTLEKMVERGHARVVGVTEGGKKQYILTEEGMFAGEPAARDLLDRFPERPRPQ